MNRNAVAIATDSAVTSRNPGGVKIHNSANKLFTLSKFEPIGMMVYASATFMGLPWETLIKVYRRQLHDKFFPSLADYSSDFLAFLTKQESSVGEPAQRAWLKRALEHYFSLINADFQRRVREHFEETRQELDQQELSNIFSDRLAWFEQIQAQQEMIPAYDTEEKRERIQEHVRPIVAEVIAFVFGNFPITTFEERLLELGVKRFLSSGTGESSGVVFVGFGRDQLLPVVEAFWIDGIYAGVLRQVRQADLSNDVNLEAQASIIPFAQSDSVMRFLKGVDPQYKGELDKAARALADTIVTGCIAGSSDAGEQERHGDEAILAGVRDTALQQLEITLAEVENNRFIAPVLDVVGSLPKEELAAIAESLVNLTSFQRKISREAETVGGPIDVAVISKGDGFVWIKRKHYFEKDLNPSFFANYYRSELYDDRTAATAAGSD